MKRIIQAIVVWIFASILYFNIMVVIPADNDRNTDYSTENSEMVISTETVEEDNMPQIDDAIKQMQTKSDSSFYSNYPIDEGFFGWITDVYGEDVMNELADYVNKGKSAEKWYKLTGKSIHVLWAEYCQELRAYTYLEKDMHWIDNGNRNDDITIDFIGDINFDNNWYTMQSVKEKNTSVEDCFSDDLLEELTNADVTVINNEFTYGKDGEALADKDYTFMANPESVNLLSIFGTDIVSLANNHVYDYGEKGLLKTIDTLEEAGIETVGAGANIDEASKCKYYIVNGRKIGILSVTQIEKFSHFTKAATATKPGVFKTLEFELLTQRIAEEKDKCDYLLVYIHWGNEGDEFFEPEQTYIADLMSQAGADAIIGGHPHRLQGCSYINGVPVAYSIGNFWFSTGSLYTTVSQIKIDKSGELSMNMIPCIQKDMTTSLITDEASLEDYFRYVADISKNIAIDKNGRIYNLYDSKAVAQHVQEFKYKSEQHYRSHNSEFDIYGNRIDQVGNLE